jgi:Holliday junction resolvase
LSRRASKVDGNQADIVAALRRAGATVLHIHGSGNSVPDLLVWFRMKWYALECKSEKGKLTNGQAELQEKVQGMIHCVRTPEEALKAIGAMK